MTNQQAAWAEQHDWHVSTNRVHDGEGSHWCVQVRGDTGEPAFIIFYDYDKLREWAGY